MATGRLVQHARVHAALTHKFRRQFHHQFLEDATPAACQDSQALRAPLEDPEHLDAPVPLEPPATRGVDRALHVLQ